MTDFVISFIRCALLLLSSLYAFIRLNNEKLRLWDLLGIPVSLGFSAGIYFATENLRILMPLCAFAAVLAYNLVRYRKDLFGTMATSIISLGISVFIMVISTFVSAPFNFIIYRITPDEAARDIIAQCVIGVFQITAIIVLFFIKRFKSGLSPQKDDGSYDFLLLVSIVSIVLLSLFYIDDNNETAIQLILIFLAVCGLGLIFWWRKHIRVNYRQTILQRNGKMIEGRLQAYEDEKNELIRHNAELAKIIHRDNKLIPAMLLAVEELIGKDGNSDELKNLKVRLEELSSEHGALVNDYRNLSDSLPKTGAISVDAVLHFVCSTALKYGVECEITADDGAFADLFACIPEQTDLNTAVCDLGENAINSARRTKGGKIKIRFETDEGVPLIHFYDSGAPFDKKVVANLGKRKTTTRQTEGGSGVGLMTLFEILRRYGASFCLDESPYEGGYTKRITIAFDKKGGTSIITDGGKITAELPRSEDPAFKN